MNYETCTNYMKLLTKIKLWLKGLSINGNEFHPSLDIDVGLFFKMNQEERDEYCKWIMERRKIEHEKDIKAENKENI